MVFNITDFIMKTLIGMVGKYPDFQVREYALNWHGKGKLTEDNLSAIDTIIELHNEEKTQNVIEDTTDESLESNTEELDYEE